MRVIDEEGNNIGILALSAALNEAAARGLDLIEIAPNATPPIARITSFDKFRYQKEKEEKKQRKAQVAQGVKHIRITPRVAEHDLVLKAKKADEFLEKGHHVEIDMRLRGRENIHKDHCLKKLGNFLKMIQHPHEITVPAKFMGRGYTTQIVKK